VLPELLKNVKGFKSVSVEGIFQDDLEFIHSKIENDKVMEYKYGTYLALIICWLIAIAVVLSTLCNYKNTLVQPQIEEAPLSKS
jgi:hypothetical protein